MALKPWYKVVTPREDLREGRPLDASEFAVHLDHVRSGRAAEDYTNPERFFDRTHVTDGLRTLGAGTLRRLSGIRVETSAVFNLITQFGGGKTHALTMLYHLAKGGPNAATWKGVSYLLDAAGVKSVPAAAVGVFVGTELDVLVGRGGDDGTPLRRTPWGDLAFQLGGVEAFKHVAQHDEERVAPSGEIIRKFLPKDRPVLILMDEILNYLSRDRSRKTNLGGQLYNFIHNLSEEARAQDRVVLAVSLPSNTNEMTPEDIADHQRFSHLLERLGKSMIMAAGAAETSEIIRRRLFEWTGLPEDGRRAASEYGEWVQAHKNAVPTWFPTEHAAERFRDTYPFHPTLLSVFDRKWRQIANFQQTRGMLRLLALWVANAYQAGFKGAHKDPLIGIGTAPLDDPLFRAAVFEQLGSAQLEGAVTADITGDKGSHSVQLDKEAVDSIKKARLHQKVATTIFFESNGGQAKEGEATQPEVRLAVAEPDLDIGNVDTALEALATNCYYITVEKNRYRFSLQPNLNKILADRRASVQPARVEERIRAEAQKWFAEGKNVDRVYFPEKSGQIPDGARLTLVVLRPDQAMSDKATRAFIDTATKEHGSSSRTFKSALIWAVVESPDALREEARKALAWDDIADEDLKLDEVQKKQLAQNQKTAERDVKEAVFRAYKNVLLLGKDGDWNPLDLGLIHSSLGTLPQIILERLSQRGDIEDKGVSPNFLARNWPPAFKEWSTRSVRDAFFASPAFPRLLNPDSIKDTISRGVENGMLGYVGKKSDGTYAPFIFNKHLPQADVEISEDVYIIQKEVAEAYLESIKKPPPPVIPSSTSTRCPNCGNPEPQWSKAAGSCASCGYREKLAPPPSQTPVQPTAPEGVKTLRWAGEIPPQRWMNFYTKVLTKFSTGQGLKLTLTVDVAPAGGVASQTIEDTKIALRELGLDDQVEVK